MERGPAQVYDLIYQAAGKDYAAESAVIDDQIRSRNPMARSLLDVACGTGGHLRYLNTSYDVMGVDLDPTMLDEARRHLPDAPLVQGDMRTFDLGRSFDVVVCLFGSIGHMGDVDQLNMAVARMAAHLGPGGVVILDGWARPESWPEPRTVHVHAGQNKDLAAARVSRWQREDRKTLLELHYVVATVDGIDHVVNSHEYTLFEHAEYEHAFRAAGLDVERVESPMPDRDRYIGRARP